MEEKPGFSTDLDINEDKTSDGTEHNENVFPLLLLPVELILLILRFLPTADRWRARVCKKLYQIEEEARFPAESVAISSGRTCEFRHFPHEVQLSVGYDAAYHEQSAIALKKVARNMDTKALAVETLFPPCWLLSLIKDMKIEKLQLIKWRRFEDQNMPEWTKDLEEWTKDRKQLHLWGTWPFSGEALCKAFSDMVCGCICLQQLQFDYIGLFPKATRKLLQLLGLSWQQETGFTSTRRDIEVFEMVEGVALEEDEYYRGGQLNKTPTRHLLILIGWKMKVAVRKWFMTGEPENRRRRSKDDFMGKPSTISYMNEMSIEKFDEDGAKPEFNPTFGLTIADIRNDRDTYSRVPLTYLE